jgi:hypothetical protein
MEIKSVVIKEKLAEMLASMYDASLDHFILINGWSLRMASIIVT